MPARTVAFPISILLASLALAPDALAAGDPARGRELFQMKGCAACHSLDGSPRPGPSLLGLVGRSRRVVTAEKPRELIADEAYIRRSILRPAADVVEGFVPGAMPGLPVSDQEVDHLVAAIVELSAPPKPVEKKGSLGSLAAATLVFVLGHLALSFAPIRRRLVGAMGEKPFMGVYSLLVTAGLIWMILAWRAAPYVEIWRAPPWARWIPLVVMPVAFVFLVAGMSTKNPTSMGPANAAATEPQGFVRITRHPNLWAFALWGLAHIPPNGDASSLMLFGGIAFLAIAGMIHIDAKRRAAMGEAWGHFAAKTSLVPFGAVLSGRTRLGLDKGMVVRILVGLVLYAGLLHGHRGLFGVSPLP
ncbi:NnrU family protein [Polyangium aurulentum]|uniref:NnrU family protein n=1 Tax=Polyangium aurulentum TaxID=2567896 RepID=UPI0010AE88F8|nr:NnrU family protein [Polyangium aurulentum]UQA60337.1 c-type cytochrome [Polyangium aurulentum]